MKKLHVLLICAFLGWQLGNAQGVNFGITGGLLNTDANIDISVFNFSLAELDAVNNTGFYIGVLVDIEAAPNFHIQPEVTYGSAEDLSFIYVPIMMKYYVIPKLNLQLGPQFNFSSELGDIKQAIRDIEGVIGTNGDLDDVLNSTAIDLGFGAGFDFTQKLRAQARYAIPLTDIYDGPLGGSLDIKNSTFQIGIAYMF